MRQIYITKSKNSHINDGYNNKLYNYYFRYDGPNSYPYSNLMTKEGYWRLETALKIGNEIIYNESIQ